MLPELKNGDAILTRRGARCRVRLVRRPARDTGYDEPLYRIEHAPGKVSLAEWTLEELNDAGVTIPAEQGRGGGQP